jgi:hypothetical protein
MRPFYHFISYFVRIMQETKYNKDKEQNKLKLPAASCGEYARYPCLIHEETTKGLYDFRIEAPIL